MSSFVLSTHFSQAWALRILFFIGSEIIIFFSFIFSLLSPFLIKNLLEAYTLAYFLSFFLFHYAYALDILEHTNEMFQRLPLGFPGPGLHLSWDSSRMYLSKCQTISLMSSENKRLSLCDTNTTFIYHILLLTNLKTIPGLRIKPRSLNHWQPIPSKLSNQLNSTA